MLTKHVMDFTLFAFNRYSALIVYKCTAIGFTLKLQHESNLSADLVKEIKDLFQLYQGRKYFSVLPLLVSMD